MEDIIYYKPNVLENEVPVFKQKMTDLFASHKVYVFGYGSLLYPSGWYGREMAHLPTNKDLVECTISGYERGPWGLYHNTNFYGVIPTKKSKVNGVVLRIHSLSDWINLMSTEMIAGIYTYANYRVVDVTSAIRGWKNKPKDVKVHCVCNRPTNRKAVVTTHPYPRYYNQVWKGVLDNRSTSFTKKFLKTGGLRSDKEVIRKYNLSKDYSFSM